jgi:uncharacterized membrane protein YqjE
MAAPVTVEILEEAGRNWVIELWADRRETFKALMAHVLAFVFLAGMLALFGWVFSVTHLADDRKRFLEDLDFYALVLAFIIFNVGFLYRVAEEEVGGALDRHAKRAAKKVLARKVKELTALLGPDGKRVAPLLDEIAKEAR